MCGVVAALGVDRLPPGLVSHRGAREATTVTRHGTMTHARLPIVGIGEENDQPIKIRDRWTVGFVGEILNFRDFTDSNCDVQLAAETFTTDPGKFSDFDGFWSIAAIDEYTQSLHILVDYLAQKPMYFRTKPYPATASEPDAVVALGPVTVDRIYMSSVIKWGYCPEPWRTPYQEVSKVMPGHHVRITRHGEVRSVQRDFVAPDPNATPDRLKAEIEAAVRRRVLSSDVPVAALVSGGLDSSIVWTLAKRHGDVKIYHVDNGVEDLQNFNRLVGSDNPFTMVNLEDVDTKKAVRYMQEPVDLGSVRPQVALSDAIKEESVCLTGDGADELLGGYGRAQRYDSTWSDVFHELVCYHLPRLDRVMMRNRVEVRSPFLSRRVVETALGLPREFRVGKKVLRDIFRQDLPPGVADVEKVALRTKAVREDRESETVKMVEEFMGSRF